MARVEDRIRQARRDSGLSQEALAERIGVPPATLHQYEEGAAVSSRHLELIAVATGKPLAFFLDGAVRGSLDGAGVGGRFRAALAWLSEPVGADTDVDALLAQVAAREREIAERERRLGPRERRLAGKEEESRESLAGESRDAELDELEQRERALAAREAELETKAELLARQASTNDARAAELERAQKELEKRERGLDARVAAAAPVPESEQAPESPAAGFNLDALEHALDERAEDFPERADEWRAYMVFLREFVHADGDLPSTFNTLVREVFRELLEK